MDQQFLQDIVSGLYLANMLLIVASVGTPFEKNLPVRWTCVLSGIFTSLFYMGLWTQGAVDDFMTLAIIFAASGLNNLYHIEKHPV